MSFRQVFPLYRRGATKSFLGNWVWDRQKMGMKMKGFYMHKFLCGLKGPALDHYPRNFILNLRYYLPKFGLTRERVTGFLVAFEVALKGIHLLN